MKEMGKPSVEMRRLRQHRTVIATLWTVIFVALLAYEVSHEREWMQETALTRARERAERDLLWIRSAGGVLEVHPPADDHRTAAAHAVHLSEGEECVCLILVEPVSGRPRALDIGAFREMASLRSDSALPAHRSRDLDDWEARKWRGLVDGGLTEVGEFLTISDRSVVRYLTVVRSGESPSPPTGGAPAPSMSGPSAISLIILTDPLVAETQTHIVLHAAGYGVLWVFGMGVLLLGHRRIQQRLEQRLLMEVALRESERRFERVATLGNVGVWELDAHARTLYVNAQMASMLGTTVGEMLGRTMYEFMVEEERRQAEGNSERRRQLVGDTHELQFKRKDGTSLWTLVATNPILDGNGGFDGAIAVVTNIGEQKKLERVLRSSEERYRRLFEMNVAGVYTTTTGGRILSCNDAFAAMLGYGSAAELIGLDARELYFSDGDREEFLAAVRARRILRGYEQLLRRKDEDKLWVVENVTLMDDDTLQGTMIDITRLRETVEALAESEERLRLLVESTDDVVAMQDLEGRFLYYNPVSRYGVPAQAVVGRTVHDLFGEEAGDRLLSHIREVAATGRTVEFSDPVPWRGEEIWFQARLYPIRDTRGAVRAVSLFGRNITEQRRAEEKLRATEERLQMERLRTQIASDLHDEIGSTLSSTAIFGELLAKEVTAAPGRAVQLLERILRNIRDVQQGLHDIVWTINPEYDTLDNLLLRLQEHATEVLEGQGIRFRARVPDAVESQRIPMNVRRDVYLLLKEGIHNIVKHSSARTVTLEVEPASDRLILVLTDDGVGFDDSRLVEGNGLRNMRRRAESMGGSVVIDSQQGRGTRVVFRLCIT